jgi:hypothetical protein
MDNGLLWPDFQETPPLLRKKRLKRKYPEIYILYKKGKVTPLQARCGPEGG